MLDPIIKTVTLPTSPARAFELFTQRIADWWPVASHSVLSAKGDPPIDVRFEPFEGGRLFEISETGETADWGKVTAWVPGAVLGFTWHPGADPKRATQVDVSFSQADTGGTLITLTHSEWARLGVIADTQRANYDPGWDQVFHNGFERFARRELEAV
nr:SRPBCC domain-containing protein [Hyphomonas sp. Mor2]